MRRDWLSIYKSGAVDGPVVYCAKLALLSLKFISVSYYVNYSHPSEKSIRPVDLYCIFQSVLLAFFLQRTPTNSGRFLVWYILFDMFLNYGNVVFLGREKQLMPGIRNIERSILLLFVSTFTLVFGFGSLYRYECRRLGIWDGLYMALFSLGTMEFPKLYEACEPRLLSSIQMFGNLFLLLIAVGLFIGHLEFERPKDRGS
jgi:hypothetical protein